MNRPHVPRQAVYRGQAAPRRSTAHIWASAIIIVALFGAGVALAEAGWKPESITGMLILFGGLASTVIVAVSKLADIDVATQVVERRTNGELQNTIRDSVRQAMADLPFQPRDGIQ